MLNYDATKTEDRKTRTTDRTMTEKDGRRRIGDADGKRPVNRFVALVYVEREDEALHATQPCHTE